ncbi:MAG: AEC family transporter [Kiritimatiellia bacterium]
METVFNTLVPVVLLVVLGFALRAGGFLPALFFSQLNRLVFWVALPAVLFLETARAQVAAGAATRMAAAMFAANVLTALVAWGAGAAMRLPAPSMRAFVQAAFRGNYAYVGLPVVFFALPEDAGRSSVIYLALALLTIVNNMLAVAVLTPFERGGESLWKLLARTAAKMLANPLVISCFLGVLAAFLRIRFGLGIPDCLARAVRATGNMSMGGALIALGAGIAPERLRGLLPRAAAATALRLVVCPLLGLATTAMLGVVGDLRLAALLFIATPAAVASYVMADQMGADRELAGAVVVLSTLCALPTLAAVILIGT